MNQNLLQILLEVVVLSGSFLHFPLVAQSRIWPVLLTVLNFQLSKLQVGHSKKFVKAYTTTKDKSGRIMLLDYPIIHRKIHNTKADFRGFPERKFPFLCSTKKPPKGN